jgi:hypothetical protein
LAKQFQRRTFLEIDQPETRIGYGLSNFNRGHSIDASYQVSVHLAKWFKRRRFLEIDQSTTIIACYGHVCLWIRTHM